MSRTGVTHREKALCKSSSSLCLSELLFHQISVGQTAHRSMTETVAETPVLEGAPHTWCDLLIPVSPWHWEAPAKRGCLSCSVHGKPDFPEAKANWWVLFVSPALPWVLAGVTTPCTGRGRYTDKAQTGRLQSVQAWHGAGHCVVKHARQGPAPSGCAHSLSWLGCGCHQTSPKSLVLLRAVTVLREMPRRVSENCLTVALSTASRANLNHCLVLGKPHSQPAKATEERQCIHFCGSSYLWDQSCHSITDDPWYLALLTAEVALELSAGGCKNRPKSEEEAIVTMSIVLLLAEDSGWQKLVTISPGGPLRTLRDTERVNITTEYKG